MKENLNLIKKTYWQIASLRAGVDRNGNIASIYLLLTNPSVHQYTKKVFFTVSDFIDTFGQPSEFSEAGLSAAVVGAWLEASEYIELLDEEPIQNKR